uniref:Uncharacterized protein n=2 Tax=viral metagenome TaxID=1070528 RepID=A0A6H1ZUB4_9ZZZZ
MNQPDNWDWCIALFALRYCIGSSSYAPGVMCDWVKRHWRRMPEDDREIMMREVSGQIARADARGNDTLLGAWSDIQVKWRELDKWMKEHSKLGGKGDGTVRERARRA